MSSSKCSSSSPTLLVHIFLLILVLIQDCVVAGQGLILQVLTPQGSVLSSSGATALLDLGIIALERKRSVSFSVVNISPADVRIVHWGSNLTRTSVEFVGCHPGDSKASSQMLEGTLIKTDFDRYIRREHYAVFRLNFIGFEREGTHYGEAFVETKDHIVHIPFMVVALHGDLSINPILISSSFPGHMAGHDVRVNSSFSHPIKFISAQVNSRHKGFSFTSSQQDHHKLIEPNEETSLGRLEFNFVDHCGYSGLDTAKEVGHLWLLGLALHQDTGFIDKELHKLLWTKWQEAEKVINASVTLKFEGYDSLDVAVGAALKWPRLFSTSARSHLRFPITRLGNTTWREVTLENPSHTSPVLAQISLISSYPNPDSVIQLMRSGFHFSYSDQELNMLDLRSKSFKLDFNHTSNGWITHEEIRTKFGVSIIAEDSAVILMGPQSKHRIKLAFSPVDDSALSSTILLVRNNLTILETLYLSGQGGSGLLKLGNLFPGRNSALTFELMEKHLKSCQQVQQVPGGGSNSKASSGGSGSTTGTEPSFSVHRTFNMVNVGRLAIKVDAFYIGQRPCEGYGFKVLNCAPFQLRPNENKKIHIAFTPDFTEYATTQELTIATDEAPLRYKLVATLPNRLVPVCAESIPRPHWEGTLYFALLSIAIGILITVICIAFLEGERILHRSFYPMLAHHMPQHLAGDSGPCTSSSGVSTQLKDKSVSAVTNGGPSNHVPHQNGVKHRPSAVTNNPDRGKENRPASMNNNSKGSNYSANALMNYIKSKCSPGSNNQSSGKKSGHQQQQSNKVTSNGNADYNKHKESSEDTASQREARERRRKQKLDAKERQKQTEERLRQIRLKEGTDNLTNFIPENPPPLPDFESSFGDSAGFLNKKQKQPKQSTSSSSEAKANAKTSVSKSVSLPPNGTTSNNNNTSEGPPSKSSKNRNSDKSKGSSSNTPSVAGDGNESVSSNESSIIMWDCPSSNASLGGGSIASSNTYPNGGADDAMDSFVRQTEVFANQPPATVAVNRFVPTPVSNKTPPSAALPPPGMPATLNGSTYNGVSRHSNNSTGTSRNAQQYHPYSRGNQPTVGSATGVPNGDLWSQHHTHPTLPLNTTTSYGQQHATVNNSNKLTSMSPSSPSAGGGMLGSGLFNSIRASISTSPLGGTLWPSQWSSSVNMDKLVDTTIDHELNILRETSSPYNGIGGPGDCGLEPPEPPASAPARPTAGQIESIWSSPLWSEAAPQPPASAGPIGPFANPSLEETNNKEASDTNSEGSFLLFGGPTWSPLDSLSNRAPGTALPSMSSGVVHSNGTSASMNASSGASNDPPANAPGVGGGGGGGGVTSSLPFSSWTNFSAAFPLFSSGGSGSGRPGSSAGNSNGNSNSGNINEVTTNHSNGGVANK